MHGLNWPFKFPKKNTEEVESKRAKLLFSNTTKRWTVKNVYEHMSVDYLEDLSIAVLKIAKGQQSHDWKDHTNQLSKNNNFIVSDSALGT